MTCHGLKGLRGAVILHLLYRVYSRSMQTVTGFLFPAGGASGGLEFLSRFSDMVVAHLVTVTSWISRYRITNNKKNKNQRGDPLSLTDILTV